MTRPGAATREAAERSLQTFACFVHGEVNDVQVRVEEPCLGQSPAHLEQHAPHGGGRGVVDEVVVVFVEADGDLGGREARLELVPHRLRIADERLARDRASLLALVSGLDPGLLRVVVGSPERVLDLLHDRRRILRQRVGTDGQVMGALAVRPEVGVERLAHPVISGQAVERPYRLLRLLGQQRVDQVG